MKKRKEIIILVGIIFSLSFAQNIFAAVEKKAAPVKAQTSTLQTPLVVSNTATTGGQNVEQILATLNETLTENRKIRQSMRDLQAAFEKVTIEKSDLTEQMRRTQQAATQSTKDSKQRLDDLTAQLNASKKEIADAETKAKISIEEKESVAKNLSEIESENAVLRETLSKAILEEEREEILSRIKENDAAVENAIGKTAEVDSTNLELRAQLIKSSFELGNMFYDLGRFKDAARQYLQVLDWDKYNAWAHHNLAVIYDYHFHKLKKAIYHYQQYLNLKLASDEAHEVRLRLWDLEQLGNLKPTEPLAQDYKRLRKLDTDFSAS